MDLGAHLILLSPSKLQQYSVKLLYWDTPYIDTTAIKQVKQLASALARSKGSDEREATGQLFGRLSLNLMRGNALMLASRAPDVDIPRAEVDGVQ